MRERIIQKGIIMTKLPDAKAMTAVFNRYKNDNPVLVRKKFQMKDYYFRRDDPDCELFHIDVGFDVEFCVIVAVMIVASVFLLCRISRACSNIRLRHRLKKH